MKPPNWSTCSEQDLWEYVAWHLEGAGIQTVLVGGAVVSIYSEGMYRSGDLDLVIEGTGREKLGGILAELGFEVSASRYFKHPDCEHLFLEFPPGPVEIGEEYPVEPREIKLKGRTLRLLSPTDCVKDRMAGYIHWNSRAYLDQAGLICKRQADQINLSEVRQWCQREGGLAAFVELIESMQDD